MVSSLCRLKYSGVRAFASLLKNHSLGDVLDFFMAWYLYRICKGIDCGLDQKTKSAMWTNITFDTVVGLVPVVGDFGDALFRCNTKNVKLLGDRLDFMYMPDELKKRKKSGERWWMSLIGRKGREDTTRANKKVQKDKQGKHSYSPATVYEEFSDDESPGLPFTEPAHQRREPLQPKPRRN